MFNVCAGCGALRADKIVDEAAGVAICPECGHRHPFVRMPLLLVGGASGSGKSTVCRTLAAAAADEVVILDDDILWSAHFEREPQAFFETWLRVCKNIAQARRPVVLFGAGTALPSNLEDCVERRYFSRLHYLALVCDDEVLTARLRARPAWRRSGGDAYVDDHVRFNRWFKEHAATSTPPIALVDTTHEHADATAAHVRDWIRRTLQ
ncbi:MAG TPA: AAA family ATPase [Polyangia bacterium]|jgi:predicted ABC-type ATPase